MSTAQKAGETLIFDVARCDWLKLDKISIYKYILRHHTWSLVRSTRRCGIWDYYYFKSPMVQWSNGFLHQDPLDEIKPKCLSSCQDWLFAPQVRQCKNQSRVCCMFMNRNYKLLRLKTKRFKKAIKGGLYQEFEVMLSTSSAIDCSVCRFYHSNSSEGRVQQLRDPHLHAHGWQRQGENGNLCSWQI